MVQRRDGSRFPLETVEPVEILRERWRKDLDRDVAIDPPVARAIHLSHSTRTQQGVDLVRTEARAIRESHDRIWEAARVCAPTRIIVNATVIRH
jgi:hypothetical protein